ncbi:MAG: hypothetical protein ACLGHO_06680 [Gammaproteobacteria bacterium]
MKKALVVSALALTITGCAAMRADREYNDLVSQAEAEIKLAQQSKFLWTNTEKFLEESKKAKEAGNTEKAIQLAKKALEEAKLAQEQAKANANPKASFAYRE